MDARVRRVTIFMVILASLAVMIAGGCAMANKAATLATAPETKTIIVTLAPNSAAAKVLKALDDPNLADITPEKALVQAVPAIAKLDPNVQAAIVALAKKALEPPAIPAANTPPASPTSDIPMDWPKMLAAIGTVVYAIERNKYGKK